MFDFIVQNDKVVHAYSSGQYIFVGVGMRVGPLLHAWWRVVGRRVLFTHNRVHESL
jgi:hypothetical protein